MLTIYKLIFTVGTLYVMSDYKNKVYILYHVLFLFGGGAVGAWKAPLGAINFRIT